MFLVMTVVVVIIPSKILKKLKEKKKSYFCLQLPRESQTLLDSLFGFGYPKLSPDTYFAFFTD